MVYAFWAKKKVLQRYLLIHYSMMTCIVLRTLKHEALLQLLLEILICLKYLVHFHAN